MTQTCTLTQHQLETFEERGVLRLEGLFSDASITAAREAVLRRCAELGLWRDGAWRLDSRPRPQWPDKGMKASEIGNRHAAVAALADEPGLKAAVDALLKGRPFDRTMHPRPQVLFTLPCADTWTLPTGWHADMLHLASGAAPGAQLFGCLDHVGPSGGGTVVVAGSHRLGQPGVHLSVRAHRERLLREPFFRGLFAGDWDGGALPRGRVDGIDQEVIEITGAPGEAWMIDPRILHSAAANAAARPRMMFTDRYIRTDLLGELAEAYGWAR